MATFTIDIGSDTDTERVTAALCAAGGYTPDAGDPVAFARQVVIGFIQTTVTNVETAALPPPPPPDIPPVGIQ